MSASLVILSFGPLAPFLQEDLIISRAQIGLFTSTVYAGTLFLGAICGWLVDRFRVRRFLLLGPGLVGLFFVGLSHAPSYGVALLFVFLGGVGYVFVNPSAAKALIHWFPLRSRATAIGIMKSGVPAGGAVGAAVLPSLALILGWRNALTSVAVAVIVFGAIAMTLYRDERSSRESTEASVPGLRQLRQVLTNRNILLLGGLGTVFSGVQLSISTYLILFLKEAVRLPVVMAGTYLTVASLSGIAGRILWGVISDRAFGGQRKIVLSIIGFLIAAIAISISFLFATAPWWLLYLMVAILGFCAFGWTTVFITFLSELGGRDQAATAVGFGIALCSLGVIFGPPLFGYIVDTTHSYTVAWSVFGICVALGGGLMMLIREQRAGG